MEDKSSLSDKIGTCTANDYADGCLPRKDVKEFIRRLKELAKGENWKGDCYECGEQFLFDNFIEDVDKLAGKELSE